VLENESEVNDLAIVVEPRMSSGESRHHAGFEFLAPQTLRNFREVRAMPQQTAYSSWSIVPVTSFASSVSAE
jgi:hypothetical protein